MVDDRDREAMDAYSAAVTTVVKRVLPSVASLGSGRGYEGAWQRECVDRRWLHVDQRHVVEGSSAVTAAFVNGTETTVDVIGQMPSPIWPCCALEVSARPVTLGDASQLQVGQLVVAVGNRWARR